MNTLGDIAASMNKVLLKRGFPTHSDDDYRIKIGWGIKRLAYLSLPEDARNDALAAELGEEAAAFYASSPLVFSRPYPGMADLVAELRRRKIKTACLTNKPDSVTGLVLNGLFPPGSFDLFQGEVKGKPRKPDPACVWDFLVELDLRPSDVIFAGDSEIDMECAAASGCFPLGVSWGFRDRDLIERAGARLIIDHPAEILELL